MKHKIFSNDDAWILGFTNPPLTPDKMWEDMIKPHIGSPIKGFMWSVGGHDIWDFETNIGERSDQAYGNSKDKIYDLYKIFLSKFNEANKYNLDLESILIEFNCKFLNE